MNTRKLEESSRLVGATSWAAIASGVFVALALQTILVLLGLAVGLSVGDGMIAGGFALWAVIVQLCSIAVGAALAAATSHAGSRMGGMAAGVMTWAVAITIGGVLSATGMARIGENGAWAAFFGALLSLGAALVGGGFGAMIGGSSRGTYITEDRGGPITAGGPL
jgi:hypothetical protein